MFLNKLTVAERQLHAAIRLYFLGEDRLAIHTVASAAYNIYSDLQRKRGRSEASWPFYYGILGAAHEFAHENISLEDLQDKFGEFCAVVVDISETFRLNPDLIPDECTVVSDDSDFKSDWYELRKAANFLKHADNDSVKLIDQDQFETEEIIYRAIIASLHLNTQFTPEKEFFCSTLYALGMLEDPPKEPLLIWMLSAHEPDEIMELGRRKLCRHLLESDVVIDEERARARVRNPYSQP